MGDGSFSAEGVPGTTLVSYPSTRIPWSDASKRLLNQAAAELQLSSRYLPSVDDYLLIFDRFGWDISVLSPTLIELLVRKIDNAFLYRFRTWGFVKHDREDGLPVWPRWTESWLHESWDGVVKLPSDPDWSRREPRSRDMTSARADRTGGMAQQLLRRSQAWYGDNQLNMVVKKYVATTATTANAQADTVTADLAPPSSVPVSTKSKSRRTKTTRSTRESPLQAVRRSSRLKRANAAGHLDGFDSQPPNFGPEVSASLPQRKEEPLTCAREHETGGSSTLRSPAARTHKSSTTPEGTRAHPKNSGAETSIYAYPDKAAKFGSSVASDQRSKSVVHTKWYPLPDPQVTSEGASAGQSINLHGVLARPTPIIENSHESQTGTIPNEVASVEQKANEANSASVPKRARESVKPDDFKTGKKVVASNAGKGLESVSERWQAVQASCEQILWHLNRIRNEGDLLAENIRRMLAADDRGSSHAPPRQNPNPQTQRLDLPPGPSDTAILASNDPLGAGDGEIAALAQNLAEVEKSFREADVATQSNVQIARALEKAELELSAKTRIAEEQWRLARKSEKLAKDGRERLRSYSALQSRLQRDRSSAQGEAKGDPSMPEMPALGTFPAGNTKSSAGEDSSSVISRLDEKEEAVKTRLEKHKTLTFQKC